jgi:hypothetical protein
MFDGKKTRGKKSRETVSVKDINIGMALEGVKLMILFCGETIRFDQNICRTLDFRIRLS